jgi:hypothetical protein
MAQVKVYNTKTGKTYPIHPSFKNDKAYLAQRGLILVENVKPFATATNLPKEPVAATVTPAFFEPIEAKATEASKPKAK